LTVNPVKRSAVPVGVLTENSRNPVVAPFVIVICTGKLVAVPPGRIAADTPVPVNRLVNTMEVAPVKFVPVIVAFIVAPCVPEAREIELIVGCGSVLVSST